MCMYKQNQTGYFDTFLSVYFQLVTKYFIIPM